MKSLHNMKVEKQFRIWTLKVDGRIYGFSSFKLLTETIEKLQDETEDRHAEI